MRISETAYKVTLLINIAGRIETEIEIGALSLYPFSTGLLLHVVNGEFKGVHL